MNRLIFYVLRGGVVLAIAIVLVGLMLLATGRPMPSGGLHPLQIPEELTAGNPAGFLGLGVLLLILTPVARVFLSILYFARERDRTYVAITLAVFLILIAGVAIGFRPIP
jgi:uncharacterized membrane protein